MPVETTVYKKFIRREAAPLRKQGNLNGDGKG